VWTGEVSTDDELLAEIHAMFDPRAASFPRLVDAVASLPDDTLKPLLAHSRQRLTRLSFDIVRNPDPLVTARHD
jgi:hypothetical protein